MSKRLTLIIIYCLLSAVLIGQSCYIGNNIKEHINSSCHQQGNFIQSLLVHSCEETNCIHNSIILGDRLVYGISNIKCWNSQLEKAIAWDLSEATVDSLVLQKLILLGINLKYVREPRKALQYLGQGLQLALKNKPSSNDQLIKIYRNIAECHKLLRDYDLAIKYLDTSYKLVGPESFSKQKSNLFKQYVDVYASLGDSYLYEAYSKAYRPYLEKKDPQLLSEYYINFSRGLSILGNYKESNRTLEELIRLNKKYKPTRTFHETKAYNLDKLGDTKNAILDWNAIEQLQDGSTNSLEILSNRIHKYSYYKDYENTYKSIIQLEHLADSLNNFSALSLAYNHKIILEIKRGELLQAHQNLEKLDQLIFQNKKTKHQSYHSESIHFKYGLDLLLQLSEKDQSYLYEAYELVERLDSITRKKIESYTSDNSNAKKLEIKKELYVQGLEICMKLYNQFGDKKYFIKAVELIEQNKAIILINNARDKINSTTTKLLATENDIKATLESQMDISQDQGATLDQRLAAANKIHSLTKLLIDLKEQDIVNLKVLSDYDYTNLNAGPAKLFYLTTDDEIYRIYIDAKVKKIDVLDFSNKDLSLMHKVITDCKSANAYIDKAELAYLVQKLLPEESYDADELLILAEGFLNNLPFEVLVVEDQYLLERTKISYAYSLQHLEMMKKRTLANNKFVIFAPTYTDQQIYVSRSNTLSKLLYNIPEVEAIKSYFPSATNHIGSKASVYEFETSAPHANILHIAAHAKSDSTEAGCHIYFSDDKENYTLSLSDIYKMNIPAELVTLSACETATGEHLAGEGVLSLARGFAYAGAKSVVSSLWSANDQSTSMIMESFYKYLSEGYRKDEALRQAKLDFLSNTDSEYHHPYYWAAFIPVGDMSPIVVSSPKGLYGAVALLIAALGFGFRQKFTKAA